MLPAVLAGERIAALAITEPSGGSDVAALRTTAVRDGDHYVVNGEKTFITSGLRADYLTVAVRTDPEAKGARGLSLLLVEGDTPGLTRTPLAKMGWWVVRHRAPALRGLPRARGQPDRARGRGLPRRRCRTSTPSGSRWPRAPLGLRVGLLPGGARRGRASVAPSASASPTTRSCATGWWTCWPSIESARAMLEETAWRLDHSPPGDAPLIASICMLKNVSTRAMQFCADAAVQTLGGMGYMRGTRSERIYREVKVNMIGGGAEEIMKELAARQLGL